MRFGVSYTACTLLSAVWLAATLLFQSSQAVPLSQERSWSSGLHRLDDTTSISPFEGEYLVGDGRCDFPDLRSAIAMLAIYGVSGPTTFWVQADTLEGTLIVPLIPGASEAAPVSFVANAGPVLIRSSSTTDTAALILAGAQWITLDGLNATAGGGTVKHAVVMAAGSAHNTIRRATLRGRGSAFSGGTGILLRGDSCTGNAFDSLTIRSAETGIFLDGSTAASNAGNFIHGCTVDTVRIGIRLQRQKHVTVQSCDLQLNGGATQEVDGLDISGTNPGDTLEICANRIHALATSSVYAVGIRIKTDTLSLARIYNNFIYDFRTTGSAQTRAFYVITGNAELTANSVRIGDLVSSGASYDIYASTMGGQGTLTLHSNIFTNYEATATAYGIFFVTSAAALNSDYNIFYGTGSGYKTGRFGTNLVTLSAWQAATGGDAHSVSGDPGFVSAMDLHVQTNAALAHQNGAILSWLTTDIDGQGRLVPPDRGADEYDYAAPAKDFAIRDFASPRATYPEQSTVIIPVLVQNRGSQTQTNVPLLLQFNGTAEAEVPVTLAPLAIDTINLSWPTGHKGESGVLNAVCRLSGDAVPGNDSAAISVSIVGQPLSGTYTLGSAASDYSTFGSAIQDLTIRGISAPVTFAVQPGTYEEKIVLPAVDGTDSTNRITFQATPAGSAVFHSTNSETMWQFKGARFVTVDGLNFVEQDATATAVEFTQQTCDCSVRNADIAFNSAAQTLPIGAGIAFSGGGNDRNSIFGATLHGFHDGLRLNGTAGRADHDVRIETCTTEDCVNGITLSYQTAAHVTGNMIHTGRVGAAEPASGVGIGTLASGQTVTVDDNQLYHGQSSAGAAGIYVNCGSGTVNVRNNMIGGWSASGPNSLYGILIGGGRANVQFNSIWMNDAAGSGDVIALADTGNTELIAQNNAFQISEHQNRSVCFWHNGTSLTSDYNAFCDATGGNPLFAVGRLGTTYRTTLDTWRSGPYDLHSVTGSSGFLDSLNLHVRPDADLFHQRGLEIAGIETDVDGDTRQQLPDIGADEYPYSTAASDVGITWLHEPPTQVPPHTALSCSLVVRNYSSFVQPFVPIELSYDTLAPVRDTLALAAGAADTIALTWMSPRQNLEIGTLIVRCRVAGDMVSANDSAAANVAVVGAPLIGNYTLGSARADFEDVQACLQHLYYRGVEGQVTIQLEPQVRTERVVIGPIAGTSETARVTFVTRQTAEQAAEWRATDGRAVLDVNGACHLSFQSMAFTAMGTCTSAVELRGGANDISFYDCRIRGADSTLSPSVGVWVQTDGCDHITLDECLIERAFTGIKFSGNGTEQSRQNAVRDCAILNARYGIYLSHQTDAEVSGNDIEPGSLSGLSAPCYGIYLTTLGSGGSAKVSGNRVHGFADGSGSISNRAVGIYAAAGADAAVTISNNFIYDFSRAGSLQINALYLSSGLNTVLFNSVLINDAPTAETVSGMYLSSGTTHTIKNNIVVSREDEAASFGLQVAAGSGLICDFNDWYGASPLFATGRIGGTTYASLGQWQAAGFDLNGRATDPRFVSPEDLHIADSTSGVIRGGVFVSNVIGDIDGQVRLDPPDVGADEFGPEGKPDTVRGLTLNAQDGHLVLRWQRTSGAWSYHVYASSTYEVAPWLINLIAATPDTSWVLTPTAGQTQQFFRVTAVNNSALMEAAPQRRGRFSAEVRRH